MFRKPFRVKSSSQMKGSERKKMKSDLMNLFPSLGSESLEALIPSGKEGGDAQIRKVYTHSGDNLLIYVFRGHPFFFSLEKEKKIIYPSIYALWLAPDLLPILSTHDPVIKNIQNGADLMCPGIVLPEGMNLRALGKGDIVSISLTGNPRSSVAVGTTAISGEDMIESGFRNRGVIILHCLGDALWSSGSQEGPPMHLESRLEALEINEEGNEPPSAPKEEEEETSPGGGTTENTPEDLIDERSEADKMNELLRSSFLTALKTSAKHVELPILTSNFYRVHMVEAAKPFDLNIKKSSYKKLSTFLRSMASELKIITIAELQKGVESIASIDYANEELRRFKVEKKTEEDNGPSASSSSSSNGAVVIEELYLVSSAVLQFFRPHPKKAVFSKSGVLEFLKDYVMREGLSSGQLVRLDPIIAGIVLTREENHVTEMRWEDLTDRVLGKMSPGYCVNGGQRKLGSLPPIEMKTATRSGNKKVTLVYNLDTYGIDPHEVAHKCQVGVAASTSVDMKPPNRKLGSEVLIQGNQIAYVTKLLTEGYGVNKKYLTGTEKAVKPKKKK
eukprot:TRINITY_DN566_c1_g1_i1.p1 TRINITY_DN566_c1_g1~~TRINITY_DN566_c1_g1_i1.p1  ORF type:complete len:560 (+),score=144.79 TRINITY_DN566_c1_g1_i1:49-1728(+)